MKRLFFALLFLVTATGFAADRPQDLLRRIYTDHQPWAGKSIDFWEGKNLDEYFDDSLVALIRKDVASAAVEQGVGCLDFDPLLDGQDYDEAGITTPQIREIRAEGKTFYEVTFTGRSDAWKEWNVLLRFDVRKTRAGWRVHDIIYKSGHSLRHILTCPQ